MNDHSDDDDQKIFVNNQMIIKFSIIISFYFLFFNSSKKFNHKIIGYPFQINNQNRFKYNTIITIAQLPAFIYILHIKKSK